MTQRDRLLSQIEDLEWRGFQDSCADIQNYQSDRQSQFPGHVVPSLRKSIRGWFSDLAKAVKDCGIEYFLTDSSRQYNGDETGFQLAPHVGKVLGPKGTDDLSA